MENLLFSHPGSPVKIPWPLALPREAAAAGLPDGPFPDLGRPVGMSRGENAGLERFKLERYQAAAKGHLGLDPKAQSRHGDEDCHSDAP